MTTYRIAMFDGGRLVPRFPSEPKLSSAAAGWADLQMETHQLKMEEELSGVTSGYQICFNMGSSEQVEWKVNGLWQRRIVGPGQFSLASHGHLRTVRWERPMQIFLVALSTRLMAECDCSTGSNSSPELVEHFGHSDDHVEAMLKLLRSDLRRGNPAGALYGEQLGIALAVYLSHRFGIRATTRPHQGNRLPGSTQKRIREYVEANLSGVILLEALATQAGMSRYHFSRLFRNTTGQTVAQYVTHHRMERAKTMLTQESGALRDIAAACGFSSQSYFTAIFRERTGGTPAQYRAAFR